MTFDLIRALDAQRPGHSLTRPFYSDPAIFETEMQTIWAREWIFAASAAELPSPGSYVTLQLGTYPVIIVRGADGVIRAFHNVCRHRGQRLCAKPAGTSAKLVCPYHQWTYDSDGRLLWARDMGADFDMAGHGLKPVACAETAGMVFVCLAATPPDFASVQAAADQYTAPHGLGDLKVAHRSRIVEGGNWKLVLENNRECYHCAGSHPALCRTFSDDPDLVGSDDSLSSPEGAAHVARCEAAGLPSRYLIADTEQWRLVRIPFPPSQKRPCSGSGISTTSKRGSSARAPRRVMPCARRKAAPRSRPSRSRPRLSSSASPASATSPRPSGMGWAAGTPSACSSTMGAWPSTTIRPSGK